MNIEYSEKKEDVTLGNLHIGDCFILTKDLNVYETNKIVYIKTDKVNSIVILRSGITCDNIKQDTEVIKLKATLVIEQ